MYPLHPLHPLPGLQPGPHLLLLRQPHRGPGEVSENDFGGGSSANGGSSEGDPLFEEAKALVLETQKASASMIQRRLSVGFNRATRLMEELEEAGVIGPAEGTKPRKVLMTQE